MKLVNLTPHDITLREADSTDLTIPSSGVARVDATEGGLIGLVLCPMAPASSYGLLVPIHSAPSWGEVYGLPDAVDGVLYIVSTMVADRCGGRADVVSPGTGPKDGAIRANGEIVAVTRLIAARK